MHLREKYLERKSEIIQLLKEVGFKSNQGYSGNDRLLWVEIENPWPMDSSADLYVKFEDMNCSFNMVNLQYTIDINLTNKEILEDIANICGFLHDTFFFDSAEEFEKYDYYIIQLERGIESLTNKIKSWIF